MKRREESSKDIENDHSGPLLLSEGSSSPTLGLHVQMDAIAEAIYGPVKDEIRAEVLSRLDDELRVVVDRFHAKYSGAA